MLLAYLLKILMLITITDAITDLIGDIKNIVTTFEGNTGLIYCQKRETCDNVVNALQRYGINCKCMEFYSSLIIVF